MLSTTLVGVRERCMLRHAGCRVPFANGTFFVVVFPPSLRMLLETSLEEAPQKLAAHTKIKMATIAVGDDLFSPVSTSARQQRRWNPTQHP